MFGEIQQHAHCVTLTEQVVLATERVEKCASVREFLGRAAGEAPGATADGTSLDANNSM